MLMRFDARTIRGIAPTALWKKIEGDMEVVCSDGAVACTGRDTIWTRFTWDLLRGFEETPITKMMHLRGFSKPYTEIDNNTHTKLLGHLLFGIYDSYASRVNDRMKMVDHLKRQAYVITNVMYNWFSVQIPEYVSSIDLLDFLECCQFEPIRQSMISIQPTPASIANCHATIRNALNTAPELRYNSLARAVRGKTVRVDQVLQAIGPVGYRTETDSSVFPAPILTGFFHGVRLIAWSAMESRSSAKSLSFTKTPLQQAEYFSRRQQLVCLNVWRIHRGDCGSTQYLTWHVKGPEINAEGKAVGNSDLDALDGKYFVNASGGLSVIRPWNKELINTTIKIRCIVAGCAHPDPNGVCEVCYGETSLGIDDGTNGGHQSCVTMTAPVSQIVISNKHFDGSAVVSSIVLSLFEKKYLSAPSGGSLYYLQQDLKNRKVKIRLCADEAPGLPDVFTIDDVNLLSASRVSEISSLRLVVWDKSGNPEEIPLNTTVDKNASNMTHQLLAHIKKVGFEVAEGGYYQVDMAGWDYSQPILSLPMRQVNMGDHQAEIAGLLESTVSDLEKRSNVVSPEALLAELFNLINRGRLLVNMAVLDLIVYSSMVISNSKADYRLPKPWTTKELGILRHNMEGRSAGAACAFERHQTYLTDPKQFVNTDLRPDHPMDALLLPEQVLGGKYGRFYADVD